MNDEYSYSVLNFIMSMTSFNISLSALTTSNRIIDFNSTFNSLQIDILLLRLINLGVNGNLICGIKDFLLNRPQKVIVNDMVSKSIIVNIGAPQGTILSPLFFSL